MVGGLSTVTRSRRIRSIAFAGSKRAISEVDLRRRGVHRARHPEHGTEANQPARVLVGQVERRRTMTPGSSQDFRGSAQRPWACRWLTCEARRRCQVARSTGRRTREPVNRDSSASSTSHSRAFRAVGRTRRIGLRSAPWRRCSGRTAPRGPASRVHRLTMAPSRQMP